MSDPFFPSVHVEVPAIAVVHRGGAPWAGIIRSRVAEGLEQAGLRNEATMYKRAVSSIDDPVVLLETTSTWVTLTSATRVATDLSVTLPPQELLDELGDATVELIVDRTAQVLLRAERAQEAAAFRADVSDIDELDALLPVIDEWMATAPGICLSPFAAVELPPRSVFDRLGTAAVPLVVDRITAALHQSGGPGESDLFARADPAERWSIGLFDLAGAWADASEATRVAPDVAIELPADEVLYGTSVDARSLLRDRAHRTLTARGRTLEASLLSADTEPPAISNGATLVEFMARLGDWVRLEAVPPPPVVAAATGVPNTVAASTGVMAPSALVGPGRRAHRVAATVEIAMWILLAVGIIGGAIIASQRADYCRYNSCNFAEKYPLFGFGIGIAIGCTINCLMVIMVAAFIQARARRAIV